MASAQYACAICKRKSWAVAWVDACVARTPARADSIAFFATDTGRSGTAISARTR